MLRTCPSSAEGRRGMTLPDTDALRARLLDLRQNTIAQLAAADHVDAGLLRLAADAGVALTALVAAPMAAETATRGDRVILVDEGAGITLASYSAAQCELLAVVGLPPL